MQTVSLPVERSAVAPDGSDVRVLVSHGRASLAQFSLRPGEVTIAVRHLTVDEAWFVVSGRGSIWRSDDSGSTVDALRPGVSLTIPCGTSFQFRSDDDSDLTVVGVTTPPWPLDRVEAVRAVEQHWTANLPAGPGLGSP
jgi:mannose-6-phosphate isomerase-like protein (cupin superfamily)